jgi:hypothetical protein
MFAKEGKSAVCGTLEDIKINPCGTDFSAGNFPSFLTRNRRTILRDLCCSVAQKILCVFFLSLHLLFFGRKERYTSPS